MEFNFFQKLIKQIILVSKVLLHSDSPKWGTAFFTRKCNLQCSYCSTSRHNRKDDISLNDWKKIINMLSEWGIIVLNIVGGEPTLRKDINEFIRYINKKGIIPFLHSNFINLSTETIDELARSGLFALVASFDSFGSFGKSNKDLFHLLEYAKIKGIIPVVSSVVTAFNIHEIPAIARFVTDRGMVYRCGLYQYVGGAFSNKNTHLIPPPDKLYRMSLAVKKIKSSTNLVRDTYKNLENNSLLYYKKWKCNPHKDYWIVVNNDGTLMPCQEYFSDLYTLSINSLSDPSWREYKIKVSNKCKGCYYHCYYEAETTRGVSLLREVKTAMKCLKITLTKY